MRDAAGARPSKSNFRARGISERPGGRFSYNFLPLSYNQLRIVTGLRWFDYGLSVTFLRPEKQGIFCA
jgi:hypothetical protein